MKKLFLFFLTKTVFSEIWEPVSVLSNLPVPRSGHSLTAYNGSIYLFGGYDMEATYYNQVEKYDPVSNLWKSVPTSGQAPSPREGHVAVLVGSKLYIHGGSTSTSLLSDIFSLDLTSNTWSELSISGTCEPRAYHSGVLHENGLVFLFGGYTESGTSDETFILDTINKHWGYPPIVGIKPEGRKMHSLEKVRNKVWMFGGESENTVLNEMWYFDLQKKHWYRWTGSAPSSRSNHKTQSYGTSIFLFGGCNNILRECYSDTYKFDCVTESWTLLDNSESIKPREAFGLSFVAGLMYVFGGRYLMEKEYGDFWTFNTDEPCPSDCSGNGSCGKQGCICNAGFTGPDCGTATKCRLDCNDHGACVEFECICYPGYYGTYCQGVVGCPNNCTSEQNGICQDSAECNCFSGYSGEDCSSRADWKLCDDLCINGNCVNLACQCSAGWVGTYCDIQQPVIYAGTSASSVTKPGRKPEGFTKTTNYEDLTGEPIVADETTIQEASKKQDSAAQRFAAQTSTHYLVPEMFGFVNPADPTIFYSKNLRRVPEKHVKEKWIADIEKNIDKREDEIGQCPLFCNYHGSCFSGVCYCEMGYTGDTCQIKASDVDKGIKISTVLVIVLIVFFIGCIAGSIYLSRILDKIRMKEESKVVDED